MQARGPGFFSFGGGRVMLDFFLLFLQVLNMFLSHSHEFSLFACPQNMFPSAQSVPQRCGKAWDDCMQES